MKKLFGIEVECFSRDPESYIHWKAYLDLRPGLRIFERGWDSSIEHDSFDFRGSEFRNTNPLLFSRENLSLCASLLSSLKQSGYEVNDTCGLHVHISTPEIGYIPAAIFGWANVELASNPYFIKEKRRKYCTNLFGQRPQRLNPIDGSHVEFRLFNGSLNVRHLMRCLHFCGDFYDKMIQKSESLRLPN